MKCKRCGAEIADDSKFCEYCGKRVKHRVWLPTIIVIIIFMVCGVLGYNINKAPKYTPTAETVNPDKEAYSISVMSSDEKMGYVEGTGTYDVNSNAKIEAVAYEGYRFVAWNDGSTERVREVKVDTIREFVAFFKPELQKKSPEESTVKTSNGKLYYSFGIYEGGLKNGIPEGGRGKMYYTCHIQIAKHDTDNHPHYADNGDYYIGSWGNGDIEWGKLYYKDGSLKEIIRAPRRTNPYDLNLDECLN